MKNGRVGDHPKYCIQDPFPKHNVFIIDVGLDLLLCFNIENLECVSSYESKVSSFQSEKIPQTSPFSARIFRAGCMIAESADMVRGAIA
jgi:hypothetical protein